MIPELHSIAQFLTLRVVDSLVGGTLIGVFAAFVLRIARRQGAGPRFVVLFAALVAIAVLPLVNFGMASLGSLSRGGPTAATSAQPAITLPDSFAVYFFASWAVLSGWFLFGVVRAVWHLHVLRKSCVPIHPDLLDPSVLETIQRHSTSRAVALCTSDQLGVPAAIGLMKPAIVIPQWVMQELSAAELNQILIHELAHLRRWDDWTNLAQQLIKAVFFFHPAVWWIEKKVALERELACDDAVLAETASPRAYAECLAHLAEKSFVHRSIAMAQAALGRIRETSLRVAQILDVNRPSGNGRTWKAAVSLLSVLVVTCAAWSARFPRLIAFESAAPYAVAPTAATAPIDRPVKIAIEPVLAEKAAFVRASVTPTQVRTAKVKSIVKPYRRRVEIPAPAVAAISTTSQPLADNPLQPARFDPDAAPASETVFVLIQDTQTSPSGLHLYQIQMWRVTVLRYKVPTSNPVPRKET